MHRKSLNDRQAARLARLLKQARADSGLSLQQLSDASGVNQATIVLLERGGLQAPHVYTVRAVGRALGIDGYELFTTAEWLVPNELPAIGAYLRTKYRDLSDADIAELQAHLDDITSHDQGRGPINDEDESDPEPEEQDLTGGRA